MTFDDLPLLTYEKEVFAECGSWKNFWDLEDCLSLEELLELYDIAIERQSRMAKVLASAFGAEVDDGPSEIGRRGGSDEDNDFKGHSSAAALPFSVGYANIE